MLCMAGMWILNCLLFLAGYFLEISNKNGNNWEVTGGLAAGDLQCYQELCEKAAQAQTWGRFSCARVAAASLANQTPCTVLAP